MKTEKQKAMIKSFLAMLDEKSTDMYKEIILYLTELGYNPKNEKGNISFKHDLHNKQMAKIGFREKESLPFFALRFSAAKNYSQKFFDIIIESIKRFPSKIAKCQFGECFHCAGEFKTHVYSFVDENGETKTHCGAYALEIPNVKKEDINEIKRLIKDEHDYLMKHEAKI